MPQFSGEEGCSSLLYESDLVHKKIQTDVILHGHAYSPGGKPTKRVDVRLKVANIDKTLRVYGDRIWRRDLLGISLTPPKPFIRMPLTYERAFGGTDKKANNPQDHQWESFNPVGTGFAIRREHLIGVLAPNIEDPHMPYKSFRQGKPAGFGPIARHWSPRVQLAGTYDDAWEKTMSPLLPSDFDERFYQCAPQDQQAHGFFKGGEKVELFNLNPEGYLTFYLPKVFIGMTTHFYDGTKVEHRAVLHTVIIRPDERHFQMVWHSNLPCHHKGEQLEKTDIILKREKISPATF